jgi:3-dehydroquinate synthase
MREITVRASSAYRVLVGSGLLNRCGALSVPLIRGRRAVVAADEHVFPLYGETVLRSLREAGFDAVPCVFPAGEEAKTPETLLTLIEALAQHELTRADGVFALGGGVTGDMAGLAAALYQRGIACIQLPTTLLAAVDASVGGKTAVNLPSGKNQLGVFAQPRLVLCDTDALTTLPGEVYAEGWAEVVKYAFLRRGALQELLLSADAAERMEEIIARCVAIKRDIVAADEFDTGERQLLNFGHTVGHAIERCGGYTWYHGMAVAAGMAIMTRACHDRGLCTDECAARMAQLLQKFHLPDRCPYSAGDLLAAARADKKRSGRQITLVLPREFGRCELRRTDFAELGDLIARGL